MSVATNAGDAAPMMGSSRPHAGSCSAPHEPARSLQVACNGAQIDAPQSSPDPWPLERTGASREQRGHPNGSSAVLTSCKCYEALDIIGAIYEEHGPPILAGIPGEFHVAKFDRFEEPPIPVVITGDRWGASDHVYRLYDRSNGALGYVGVAKDWCSRINEHARDKCWWPQINFIAVHALPTREDAMQLEAFLIARYEPPYNVAGPSVPTYLAALSELVRREYESPRP